MADQRKIHPSKEDQPYKRRRLFDPQNHAYLEINEDMLRAMQRLAKTEVQKNELDRFVDMMGQDVTFDYQLARDLGYTGFQTTEEVRNIVKEMAEQGNVLFIIVQIRTFK